MDEELNVNNENKEIIDDEELVTENDSQTDINEENEDLSVDDSESVEDAVENTSDESCENVNQKPDETVVTKKKEKQVKLSTTIVTVIIAVLISIIVGTQLCFVVINSVYEKKYEAYISEKVKEASEKAETATQKPVETENPIVSIIENITKLYDEHYIYENKLYDETYLKQLVLDYIALTGDKYGFYYTADEWEKELNESKGNGYGIGIYYNAYKNKEGIYVLHVMSNTPAEKAGIQDGDVILKIDGDYISEDYDNIVTRLKGETDEVLSLTVLRDGVEFDVSLTRSEYDIETVLYSYIEEEGQRIARIRILSFDNATIEQFRAALNKSIEDECSSIVFDLRDNLGGEINSLVQMLDMLLPDGPILYFLDLDGNVVNEYTSKAENVIVKCPMVVLVNGNTASSAEAFSSALRDYKLATLVGEQTYGKGCVLSGYYTKDGGVLYLTTRLYKTAVAECFDNVGLTPDVVIGLDYTNLFKVTYEEDLQLQEAVRILLEETNN